MRSARLLMLLGCLLGLPVPMALASDSVTAAFGVLMDDESTITLRTYDRSTGVLVSTRELPLTSRTIDPDRALLVIGRTGLDRLDPDRLLVALYDLLSGRLVTAGQLDLTGDVTPSTTHLASVAPVHAWPFTMTVTATDQTTGERLWTRSLSERTPEALTWAMRDTAPSGSHRLLLTCVITGRSPWIAWTDRFDSTDFLLAPTSLDEEDAADRLPEPWPLSLLMESL